MRCPQDELPLVFCPEPPSISYLVICRWLRLVLGLEVLRLSQTLNQGQLLLVLGLGPLRDMGHTDAQCCMYERF